MTAEEKLAKIAAIFDTETVNEEGCRQSTNAYYNLEGAIIDIEHSHGHSS